MIFFTYSVLRCFLLSLVLFWQCYYGKLKTESVENVKFKTRGLNEKYF